MEAAIACLLSNPSLGSIDFLHVAGSTEPLIAVKTEQSRVAISGVVQGVMHVVVSCPHCEEAPCVLYQGELGKYLQDLGRSMSGSGERSTPQIANNLKGIAHQRLYGEEHVMLPDCVVNFVDDAFPAY
jgi:hypothetical protein